MLKQGGRQSKMDPSLFIFEREGKLEGLLATHVDDLLGVGGEWFNNVLLKKLDDEFGFGSQEFDDFRHTGKRTRKDMKMGEIQASTPDNVENVDPPRVSLARRKMPDAKPLRSTTTGSSKELSGCLPFLQGQIAAL